MVHRKYSRTRNKIHKAMARHPGQRKSKTARLEQALIDQGLEPPEAYALAVKPEITEKLFPELKKNPIPNRPGFFRRIFNRKTGG